MEGVLSLYRPFDTTRQMGCYQLFPEKITTHGQRINFMKNICDRDGQFKKIYGDTIKDMVKFLAIDITWGDITNNKPLLLNVLGIEHDFEDQDTVGKLLIKNLYIDSLNFKNGDQVTNIELNNLKELKNISGIEKLKRLDLNNLKTLKNLNLSGCTSLESLTLRNLQLKKISGIENLKNLKILTLDNLCKLEDINLSGCKSLEELTLDFLSKLKKISGLEKLHKLKTLSLLDLYELKDLDLRGCTFLEFLKLGYLQLENISGLEKLDKLERLWSDHVGIETLNLSGCTSLKDPRFLNFTKKLKTICISLNVPKIGRDCVEKYCKSRNITVTYTDQQNREEQNQIIS